MGSSPISSRNRVPLFRLLEQSLPVGFGVGEGPAFVAEQFAFQERFRQGRIVDGNKRRVEAFAVPVQGSGDQFLAGAALPRDEDGNVGLRHADDLGKQGFHGRAVADEVVEPPGAGGFPFQALHFPLDGAMGDGPVESRLQEVHVDGFGHEIIRPGPDRCDGAVETPKSGDGDNGDVRPVGRDPLAQFNTGHAR